MPSTSDIPGNWRFRLKRALLAVAVGVYRSPLRPLLRPLARRYKSVLLQTLSQPSAPQSESPRTYETWVQRYDTLRDADRAAILRHIGGFARRPLFSIVMPVYNPPEAWLRRAIESVREQLYPHWELCIADDASTLPHVRQVLLEAAADPRVRVEFRAANGGIAAASNSALALARGEFVGLLDHDDELAEHALYHVAAALNEHPDVEFFYSDEDKLDEQGRRSQPYFKPDWNLELERAQNYVCHFAVYRRRLLEEIGGFRPGFDGSQDYDLALRACERIAAERIRHLPYVLYHWRMIAGSTAQDAHNKGYAQDAARRAVQEHLQRTGTGGRLEAGLLSHRHRVVYPAPDPQPLVSIIIPTRDREDLLRRCLDSLWSLTSYRNTEVLVVDNQSSDPASLAYLASLADTGRARVLRYDLPFNYAAINNFAAAQARGELLCLLNNDTEVLAPEWLTEMVSHAARPEIGAVGAKLLYGDGRVQHGGVILGLYGIAGHAHRFFPGGEAGYFDRLVLAQELSAVTAACLVVRREVYWEVDGLNAQDLRVAFNDVDFCLRIREAGYRNLWTPFALLYHHESATRGPDESPAQQRVFRQECQFMYERWGAVLQGDPAFNPNLALNSEGFALAWPPRAPRPWETPEAKAQAPGQGAPLARPRDQPSGQAARQDRGI